MTSNLKLSEAKKIFEYMSYISKKCKISFMIPMQPPREGNCVVPPEFKNNIVVIDYLNCLK